MQTTIVVADDHRLVREGIRKLLDMHLHPEQTGFGTVGIHTVLEKNTTAMERNALALDGLSEALHDQQHLIEWAMKRAGIEDAPPPRVRLPGNHG